MLVSNADYWTAKYWQRVMGSIRSRLERSTELSFWSLRKTLTPTYWLAVVVASLAAWGFEHYYANAQFNTLYYRLGVCLIGIPLFVSPFPKNEFLRKNQRLYFVFFIFLLLPVLLSWNVLSNAAYADSTESLSGSWLTEYAFAVFLFLGLFSKPVHALVMCFVALAISSSIVLFFLNPTNNAFLGTILFMVATIVTAYCFILTTHQQLNYVLQHRLETAYSVGSRVAHELRTPLLSIRNFANNAQKVARGDLVNHPEPEALLASNLNYILKEVEFSNRTIDILLVSTSKAPFNFDLNESFNAGEIISKAVSSYPYSNTAENQCLVIKPGIKLELMGPGELVVHALYNLIKNALLAANSYSESKIEIRWFVQKEKGIITVTDNGSGVPKHLENKVFDDFFTTRNPGDGTGLGLAFCKSLMTQIGGKIDYQRTDDLSIFRMSFLLKY